MGCVKSKDLQEKQSLVASEKVSTSADQRTKPEQVIPGRERTGSEDEIDLFLEESQFFKHLDKKGLKEARKHLAVVNAKRKEIIIERNAAAQYVHIVVKGKVKVSSVGAGKTQNSRIVQSHETFGEAGFFYKIRHTFVAESMENDTVLLRLTRDVYNDQKKQPWLAALDQFILISARQRVTKGLRDIDFLSAVEDERVITLGKLFKVKRVTKGETIFKQGDPGESFFVLAQGELVVTLHSGLDLIEVKTLTQGESFGEISLLERSPRSATVTALQDSTIFVLHKTEFDEFKEVAPDVYKQMKKSLKERSTVSILSRQIPFMQFLDVKKLHLLASVSNGALFQPKKLILQQGSTEHAAFHIISHGTVDIIVNGQKVRTLGEGEYFGELSLVSNNAPSATVRAGSKGARCLVVSKEEFQSLFTDEPAIYAEVQLKVLGVNCELAHILNHPTGRKVFKEHCQSEYAEENISFYLAAEHIERMGRHQVRREVLEALGHDVEKVVLERKEELKNRIHQVYDRFIDPEGAEPINILSTVRTEIETNIEEGNYKYNIFTRAKEEVYKLMERDNYARFQQSDLFQQLLEQIGVYGDKKGKPVVAKITNNLVKKQPEGEIKVSDQIV